LNDLGNDSMRPALNALDFKLPYVVCLEAPLLGLPLRWSSRHLADLADVFLDSRSILS